MMRKMIKTAAMLSLSACVVAGGTISSFAAAPEAGTLTVWGHATSTCEAYSSADNDNAVILAQFRDADGTSRNYAICAECGEVNGKETLTKVENTFANFNGLQVYTGTLDNGEKVMTVTCLSGQGAMTDVSASVEMPASVVQGYDLYLVNADGTETKLDVSVGRKAFVKVNMQDGAALIHMVAQTNA